MKVKIKTWDAMHKEFGITNNGNIHCRYYFTTMMEEDLPKNRIIEVIDEWWNNWAISDDMIEEIIEE